MPEKLKSNPKAGFWLIIGLLGAALSLILLMPSDSDIAPTGSIKEQVIARQKAEAAKRPTLTAAQIAARAKRQKQREHEERLVIQELASYRKDGSNWRNFLVQRNISKNDLIVVAKQLRNKDVLSCFRLIDDDSKFDEFIQWDIYYPSSSYPYPEKWVNEHLVGMINKRMTTHGMRWVLTNGYGDETIAELD